MDRADKVRACYLHACLKYVDREVMTNTSLRNRFGIDDLSITSRIIRETAKVGLVRPQDENAAPKLMKYLPFWA